MTILIAAPLKVISISAPRVFEMNSRLKPQRKRPAGVSAHSLLKKKLFFLSMDRAKCIKTSCEQRLLVDTQRI